MAIVTAMCTSFKVQQFQGISDFTAGTGDLFKIALYTSLANLDATTTVYSTTEEVVGVGYTAGGANLTSVTPVADGTTAICDFADVTFAASTITARGVLIYNSTDGDVSVSTHDFGADFSSVAGDFNLLFPAADAANAILRLA